MTTLIDRAAAHDPIPAFRLQDVLPKLARKARAFHDARKAALLEKKTDLIVSNLDAHVLRDIGLDPEIAVRREQFAYLHRSGIYGLW